MFYRSIFISLRARLRTRLRTYTIQTKIACGSCHSYMHLYMHPEGVHPAMEASSDCITKIEVQRYNYAKGWRVGFDSYITSCAHVHENRYRGVQ